ncbi:MAG: hypothetical protein HFG34_02525 [Eubacterium sp.]|nr:hypothetical protein [Eubacterium sp.]
MKKEIFVQAVTFHESITIPIEMKQSIDSLLKRGVYKELHRRKMLSDGQLDMLLASHDMIGGSTDGE